MRKLPLIIGLAMLSIGGTIALLSCPMLLVADIFALAAVAGMVLVAAHLIREEIAAQTVRLSTLITKLAPKPQDEPLLAELPWMQTPTPPPMARRLR